MYEIFGLVLMVTHACNLRCRYCYTGTKFPRSMGFPLGRRAIDRALRSIHPGGVLELGFFGGEPLLKSERIAQWIDHARHAAEPLDITVRVGLTTNGTVQDVASWRVMTRADLKLCVSHDGLPEIHDRHRSDRQGRGTSAGVMRTIRRLLGVPRDVEVVTVARPDTVARLPDGIAWLREQGVRHVTVSLDLWTAWNREDLGQLERAVERCAQLWHTGLPGASISWFDEKAAQLAGLKTGRTARCGFGDGEMAVAPSGNLYPCERLIGEDAPGHPLRLPGHVLEGDDFCFPPAAGRAEEACLRCAIRSHCNTTCRCSNYVRTGDVQRTDALLCLLEKTCLRETARALQETNGTSTLSFFERGGTSCLSNPASHVGAKVRPLPS